MIQGLSGEVDLVMISSCFYKGALCRGILGAEREEPGLVISR